MPRTSCLPGSARHRQRQWSARNAGFTGYDAPRVMFPFGVVRFLMMLRIVAGMDQLRSQQLLLHGWYCLRQCTLRCVRFPGSLAISWTLSSQTAQNPVEAYAVAVLSTRSSFLPCRCARTRPWYRQCRNLWSSWLVQSDH